MRVGLEWLREYVDIDIDATGLAARLTESLAETAVVTPVGRDVTGVVAAKVVTAEPHPDAEKLSVCVVDWGGGSSTVVCGAPNVRAGMTGILALPGARLPGRIVSEETIRGRRSHGMLVSAAELGLEESSEGIIELGETVEPGLDVRELLGLNDDVLEIDVQPNRPDCMGVIGIAREVAAVLGAELRLPNAEVQEGPAAADDLVGVEIEDPKDCRRYIARVIQDVVVGASPAWLQRRLRGAGFRSISNVVDVTNFVMLEYGQPIHAFDYDALPEKRIVVRRAALGDVLTTLDGEPRSLEPEHLLICAGSRPVALAGIMGGAATEVSDATRNVLLECASFDPVTVRRCARSLGLRTEASQRFERGVDTEAMPRVAARACALLAELAGGSVARGRVDVGVADAPRRRVRLRLGRVRAMLAPDLTRECVVKMLTSLGFDVEPVESDSLDVGVPSHRVDVEVEADLIEEVARLYGHDRISAEIPFHRLEAEREPDLAARNAVRDAATGLGFYEVLTTSFMAPAACEALGHGWGAGEPVALTNPVNREMPLLRNSLIPGILDVVERNWRVGERDLRIFEVGKVFWKEAGRHCERWNLAGAMAGSARRPAWDEDRRGIDFYDGKGVLWALGEALSVDTLRVGCYDGPTLEAGAGARLSIGDREVGAFGMVAESARAQWGIPQPVFVFELSLDELCSACRLVGSFEALPRYPKVRRDVALVLDEGVQAGDVLDEIQASGERLLAGIDVFDLYRGPQLPAGKKSVAFTLTYRARDRTLTDAEVDEVHDRIVQRLVARFGATLRE